MTKAELEKRIISLEANMIEACNAVEALSLMYGTAKNNLESHILQSKIKHKLTVGENATMRFVIETLLRHLNIEIVVEPTARDTTEKPIPFYKFWR